MKIVSIVADSTKNLYFALMSDKLVSLLTGDGYLVVSYLLNGSRTLFEALTEGNAIGIKECISYLEPTEKDVDYALSNGINLYLVGRRSRFTSVRSVYTDDVKGGRLAAEFLVAKQCESFVYAGLPGSECSVRREQGFAQYLEFKNREYEMVRVEDITLCFLKRKLEKGRLGVFVYSDEVLFNLMLLFKRFRIPKGKIEMIGYDGVSRDFECIGNFPSICFSYDEIAQSVRDMVEGRTKEREIVHNVSLYRV